MKIIDSNPSTSQSIESLKASQADHATDALFLSQDNVLRAGETWKGKALRFLGKIGIMRGRARAYEASQQADSKRAKEAVYTTLKEKYPMAIDFNHALEQNHKERGFHGMDKVSSHLQFSRDLTMQDNAPLTCGEVRSLFDTVSNLKNTRLARLHRLGEEAVARSHAQYEALKQEILSAPPAVGKPRTVEQTPPEPKSTPVASLSEQSVRETENTPPPESKPEVPKEPFKPRSMGDDEKPLYDPMRSRDRYQVPASLVNQARINAFTEDYGNIVDIMKELEEPFDRIKPERIAYVRTKLTQLGHARGRSGDILTQELTRREIRTAARDAMKEALSHKASWSKLQTTSLNTSKAFTGDARKTASEVSTLVRYNMEHFSSFLEPTMMTVFANEADMEITRAQEKTVLKHTTAAMEKVIRTELRNVDLEEIANIAKSYINEIGTPKDEQ